ncbi:MAG: sulfite exporter TauE/SafE family protein [bacterium]|nr:sulfite exporter TauE/SafE family protein [bacterium]
MTHFPISGVDTHWWLPMVVAFVVSTLMAPGGLSGAFLLLPFQLSILGFTGPAVTPTNLIFNVIAIPSGVLRYWREKRMVWPLAWATLIGTLPGIFIGAWLRIKYLPDPRSFKLFVGCVLLYIAGRLVVDIFRNMRTKTVKPSGPSQFEVSETQFNLKRLSYVYNGVKYASSTPGIMLLSFIVGIIGGMYGIGGGAIIAPFFVTFFRLPVHSIAGASLLGTLVSSAAGVGVYTALAPLFSGSGIAVMPDWHLGALFGIGGAAGIYVGARLQKHVPAVVIKMMIAVALLFISINYVVQFFR